MNDITRLYREIIERHAANPVGYRMEIDATHEHEEYNPFCGDRILMRLRIEGERVEATAFEGEACVICMASASLLCEKAPGKPVSHLEDLHDRLLAALGGDHDVEGIEELRSLLGVRRFPSRIQCATLPWVAARKAL